MNCFQISIFAVANTTGIFEKKERSGLWIAFKLVSLQLQTQPKDFICDFSDTLWIAFKLVSLQLQTQLKRKRMKSYLVVNCFQISIFAVANTTYCSLQTGRELLWIAFKLVSLQLQTQQVSNNNKGDFGCELLSN